MSIRSTIAALAAAFSIALAAPALAHSVTVGKLSLTDLWTRATPPQAPTAAGYLTISNKGTEPDRLIAASSPAS
jgi:copper(I)-binding protein